MLEKIDFNNIPISKLYRYYVDYCSRNKIGTDSEKAKNVWLNMYFTWKAHEEWVEN